MGWILMCFVLILDIKFGQQTIIPEEVQQLTLPSYFAYKMQASVQNEKAKINNSKCYSQLQAFGNGLLNGETWTIEMVDATGKLPSGLLEGNIDMGSFDKCIKVKSNDQWDIIGQYCIAIISFTTGVPLRHAIMRHDNGDPNPLRAFPTMDEAAGIQLRNAFCVPNGCTAEELSIAITDNFTITFLEEGCQTINTLNKLDPIAIAFISFCCVILAIALISTLYDTYYYYAQRDAPYLIVTTFSLLTNGRKLLRTSKNPDVISCLHGVRSLSIVWVIIGHTYVMRIVFPLKNLAYIMEWLEDVGNMFIIGATVSVDSFFLVSGLTLTYSYLIFKRKGKKFNLLLFYIHRYLRLTPALAIVIFFQVSLLKYMGSGPMWSIISYFEDPCKRNWWKALLYIQNYGIADGTCIAQSWYLSVDTQLYVLSPIILLPLSMRPKLTLIGTGLLTVLSIVSCFLTGWFFEFNALVAGGFGAEDSGDYSKYYYNATHTRAAVWLVGVLYGYLLFKVKNGSRKVVIHKGIVLVTWIISLAVLSTCVLGGHHLVDLSGENLNKFENSIYLALVRPSWGICLGWIIFMCFIGYGGPVNWFLSLPAFEITAKLSYCMYLVHFAVMLFHAAQLRTPAVFSNFEMMFVFWGDFGYTIIFSILLYLVIEYPIASLEQQLLVRAIGNVQKKEEVTPHEDYQEKVEYAKRP